MAYDEKLAARIRERLGNIRRVKEKQMMGGVVYMVNDKMCVGIFTNQLMVRVDRAKQDELLEKPGTEVMSMKGRSMNGYIVISDDVIKSKKAFDFWIDEALAFNKFAKSSKK